MVSTALLLDNMLFMVIVPIITQILALDEPQQPGSSIIINRPSLAILLTWLDLGDAGPFLNETSMSSNESENMSIGILFASKAIVQLLGNALIYFNENNSKSVYRA